MTAAEAPTLLRPETGIEEDLCRQLAEEVIPEIQLTSLDHETKISGAKVGWSITRPEDDALIKDKWPIVIENGLCGSGEAYASLAESLASRGYIVITKQPPRHQRADVAYNLHNLFRPMELQAKATWATMRGYMRLYPPKDKEVIQQFHLLCHSMGGPVGTDVAEHHSEHVASVTLIGSAGLEKHNTFTLAKRVPKVLTHEVAPAIILPGRIANTRLARSSVKHIAGALNRTGREALQVSNHYTVPALQRLGRLGIDLFNIQPENDHFFPYHKQLGAVTLFNRFVRLNVGKADHLAPQTQSELVAAIMDDFIKEAAFEPQLAA